MIKISGIIVITIVTVINFGALANTTYELRHPRNLFILHKCTATAELSRRSGGEKHLNETVKETKNKPVEMGTESDGVTDRHLTLDVRSGKEEIPDQTTKVIEDLKRVSTNEVRNTPLTTVNIKAVRNRSPIFKKKSLLPELEDTVVDRSADQFQNIIRIKPSV